MTTFGDQLFENGGVPVGIGGGGSLRLPPRQAYFVDATNGLDNNTGKSWESAFKTIQAACTKANSASQVLKDTDIYVGRGLYEETVSLSRAASALGSGVMLWADGGQTAAGIGTIRLIAGDNVFLHNGAAATAPALYIGRPCVEVHNFGTIKNTSAISNTAGNWDSPDNHTISEHGMPAVFIERNYNADAYTGGAANKVKIVNCRINGDGQTDQGSVLSMGVLQLFVINCIIEYGDNYGLAIVGSDVGSTAENLVQGCIFNQNTDTDILHGSLVTSWIDSCIFANPNATAHLSKYGSEANALYCTMTNCSIPSETTLAKIISAGNSTFASAGTQTGHAGTGIGDSDLVS